MCKHLLCYRIEQALQVLEAMPLDAFDDAERVQHRSLSGLAHLRRAPAEHERLLPIALDLVARARQLNAPAALAAALCLQAEVKSAMWLGNIALPDRAEALALCLQHGLLHLLPWTAAAHIDALINAGLHTELVTQAKRWLAHQPALPPESRIYVLSGLGSGLFFLAEAGKDRQLQEEAVQIHIQCLDLARQLQTMPMQHVSLINAAIGHAKLQQAEQARQRLAEQRALNLEPRSVFGVIWICYCEALIDFAEGRSARGRERITDLCAELQPQPLSQGLQTPLIKFYELLLEHPDPALGGADLRVWAAELARLHQEQSLQQQQISARGLAEFARASEIASQNRVLRQHSDTLTRELAQRNLVLNDTVSALQSEILGRERAEAELQRANDALEQRVIERTEQLQVAQLALLRGERAAALSQLVAGVAHRLNTPLGNALVAVSSVREHCVEFSKLPEGSLTKRQLNQFILSTGEGTLLAEGALSQAVELVRLFQEVASLETPEAAQRFDLVPLIRHAMVTVPAEIPLHTVLPERCVAQGYPSALGEVLNRLLENAVHHGQPKQGVGGIWLTLQQQGGELCILVQDAGPGLSAEAQRHAFDPLNSALSSGGLGLGLHIAQRLCSEVMQGRLELSSAPGQGCRFALRLPWALG